MSKHVLPADDEESRRTVWILPDDDPKADPGWRLILDKQAGEMPTIAEEQVLPEKVDDPNTHRRVKLDGVINLKHSQAVWLRDALTEMLDEFKEDW